MKVVDVMHYRETGLCSFKVVGMQKSKRYSVQIERAGLDDSVWNLRSTGEPEFFCFENEKDESGAPKPVRVRVFKSRTLTIPGDDQVLDERVVF